MTRDEATEIRTGEGGKNASWRIGEPAYYVKRTQLFSLACVLSIALFSIQKLFELILHYAITRRGRRNIRLIALGRLAECPLIKGRALIRIHAPRVKVNARILGHDDTTLAQGTFHKSLLPSLSHTHTHALSSVIFDEG